MSRLPSRRFVLTALPIGLLAGAAQASEHGSKTAAEPSVRLASVGIPVMRDRQVVNYLFLSIRINLSMTAPEGKLRELEPVFRDTVIRVSHRISFGQTERHDLLDEARFKSVMMPEFVKIAGPGNIKSIDILSQSPKKHLS
ncbi:hypothetical protein ABAC460_12680 [Asticcacaulis sp. AC460]|uniref:hypothetical protein n=1 Tax=Asticcacaulis sp. AC460 TaxID=1282360 RepID=UPI0003C3D6C6|nr:hypothetical protein [Asticcacaulis sp. AC460]ESQ89714.1 hypothetical protein ABAC460_12680 [Asticcacaulis sp. AC460]